MSKRIEAACVRALEAVGALEAQDPARLGVEALVDAVRLLADLDDPGAAVTPEVVLRLYNENRGSLPEARGLTPQRKKAIRGRLRDHGEPAKDPAWWASVFRAVAASDHHCGVNDSGWIADLSWILKPDNFARFAERASMRTMPRAPHARAARSNPLEAERRRSSGGPVIDVGPRG